VIVHDVEMDHVGTARQHGGRFLTQPGEVRRQNGRRDQILRHRLHSVTPPSGREL